VQYTNRIPEDDFQVCSKHKRAERGSASEPTGNTLKRTGFEFREFSQKKILLTLSLFLFDILVTVHLSIFISVINQLDAQNLFQNKFYFMPLHVSSTCAYHQEVKIAPIGVMIPEAV